MPRGLTAARCRRSSSSICPLRGVACTLCRDEHVEPPTIALREVFELFGRHGGKCSIPEQRGATAGANDDRIRRCGAAVQIDTACGTRSIQAARTLTPPLRFDAEGHVRTLPPVCRRTTFRLRDCRGVVQQSPAHLPETSSERWRNTTQGRTRPLLGAAGARQNPAYPLDGIDLLPLLQRTGSAPARPRQLFWRIGGQRAVRDGNLKYVRLANTSQVVTQGGLPAASLGTEFLFDVTQDPHERANLLDARPEDAARLSAAWEGWNATLLPELPARSAG
jgi:hypothetical protein